MRVLSLNAWSQILVIFNHLKLLVEAARHNFMRVEI